MHFAPLSRPTQFFLGGLLLGTMVILLVFSAIPVAVIVIVILALAFLPPWVVGSFRAARHRILADRLATDVVRASAEPLPQVAESHLIPDGAGGHIPVVPPSPAWREARERIDRRVMFIQMHGRVVADRDLVMGHGKPYLANQRLSAAHQAILNNQLVRLHELNEVAHAANIVAPGLGSIAGASKEIEEIRLSIYELVGAAVTGDDPEVIRAQPHLDRHYTAIAECEQGHLGTPEILDVFIGPDGRKRVGRRCMHCLSLWSEWV